MKDEIRKRIDAVRRGEVPEGYSMDRAMLYPDDWGNPVPLNTVLKESKARNDDLAFGKEDVLSVSGEQGIVNQMQLLGRSYAGESVAPYHVVETGDVVYTKSPLKENPYGIIKQNRGKPGIVSTLYAVYHCDNPITGQYLENYFSIDAFLNNYLKPLVKRGAKNDMKVNNEDVLLGRIPLPPIDEQRKINEVIAHFDQLIELKGKVVEELQSLKKTCLAKMFPREGENVPELRFPGFTGSWERRKVSDMAEITTGGTPSTGVQSYWEPKEIPWLSSGEVHKKYIFFTDNKISTEGMNNSSARMVKENSVLIALAGQGKTRGTVAINRIPVTTNQSIAAMSFSEDIIPEFAFCNLDGRYDEIRKMSSGDGSRGGLNKQIVGDIEIPYTSLPEQEQVGNFFHSLDNLITLCQRELEAEQQKKEALMQLLLTGLVRVPN